jgi:hypothetical protein
MTSYLFDFCNTNLSSGNSGEYYGNQRKNVANRRDDIEDTFANKEQKMLNEIFHFGC